MKKNTFQKTSFFKKLFVLLLLLSLKPAAFSQVQQNGIMHVEDNTIFFVSTAASTVNFGAASNTTTTRTPNIYGKLQFANGLTINAADPAKVNGYVSSLSSSNFFAPTGSSSLRRVINFSDITNNIIAIDVAYYEANPKTAVGPTISLPVEDVTTLEYFHIKSADASAKIEYSWEASNDIATLTDNKVKNVALVGYNGTSWVEIPSTLVGNLTNGSVTSTSTIKLSDYEYYSLGVISGHIATLNCTASNSGSLVVGVAASGVSAQYSYTGGNGRTYNGQTVNSTGVTGLTATLVSGDFTNSTGTVTYNISGTASSSGTASFAITVDGQNCTLNMTVGAASIASIDCAGAINIGILTNGTVASGISSTISYTGGNGGTHSGQIVNSTGVSGLTATLSAGNFASGSGTLLYTITGTPLDSGNAFFVINIGGRTCSLARFVECRLLISSSGNTKTWNGSWTPSPPTIDDPVIINAPYSNGSFKCNSMVLNADLTIGNDQTVEIERGVTTTTPNRIIMAPTANLVQRDAGASAPTIQLTKSTRSLRRDDYTYFGTPIAGNFLPQLSSAISETGIRTGALNGFYRWTAGNTPAWSYLTTIQTGYGFIGKITNQPPFTSIAVREKVSFVLTGVTNNGNISVPIIRSTNPDPDYYGNYNLLANPYPSAIYADKFLEDNTSIDGVIYIWVAANQVGTGIDYLQDDYIAYTKMGTTIPSPTIPVTFNGQIATGQGFMVKASSTGTVNFNNCLRLVAGTPNNSFFKTSGSKSAAQVDRFKLNLTNDSNVFSQILIGYLPNCTTGYDRMFDASRNSVLSTQLFSYIESGQRLAINARPSFNKMDSVPLGISKSNTINENFRISITEKEGIFEGTTVNIFLHDKLLNKYHNFIDGDYNFTNNSTFVASRFVIVYDYSTLENSVYDTDNLVGFIKSEKLNLSAKKTITSVKIYDVSGRNIESFKINELNKFERPFNHAESIYIVKVKFADGKQSTLKLTNEK